MGNIISNKYYMFNYTVPAGVKNDQLLTGGHSQIVSARFLRRSNGRMVIDDGYFPNNKKLDDANKFVSITYAEDSKDHYNKTGGDKRGDAFDLNPLYISGIVRIPNKRDSR